MGYEWNKAKEKSNQKKHGICFADAVFVFNDEHALSKEDDSAEGEQRWLTLGVAHEGCIVVVWTYRVMDTIRIISARKATKHERKQYWKGVNK
ncbi:MAG: BrnT family toxin [Mariprofundaceae bacterium]|nr:BrnT family toxin [Mariprofundaceae bacterium]